MPIGSSDRINVGVLAERARGERRVALVPADIRKLISKVTFVIESGAGNKAGFDDNTYVDAGARIAGLREILESSDVVVKVRPPGIDEIPPAGRTLISLGGHDAKDVIRIALGDIAQAIAKLAKQSTSVSVAVWTAKRKARRAKRIR